MRVRSMFISIGFRVLINVEALNMVESVGNVIRHRTVPYVYRRGNSYLIQWTPALSGEMLAHAFQTYLAQIAKHKYNLPVCYWCSMGEFIKHFDLRFWDLTKDKLKGVSSSVSGYTNEEMDLAKKYHEGRATLDAIKEIEETIVKICTVEDVGGFLVTQGAVKRTSRVWFSYVIPTLDSLLAGAVAVDNQFMVRHAPIAESLREKSEGTSSGEKEGKKKEEKEREQIPPIQAPYYPQIASAVYGFTVAIDLDSISKSSIDGRLLVKDDEREKRILATFDALKEMLDSRIFGARLSRVNPFIEFEMGIAIVANKIKMMVSPPTLKFEDFIEESVVRALRASMDTQDKLKVIVWSPREDVSSNVDKVLNELKKRIKEKYGEQQEKTYENIYTTIKPPTSVRDLIDSIVNVIKQWKTEKK